MEIPKRICKFCLVKCENFQFVEGNTKDFVDIVLTNIEFTIIQEPVICKNCEEMLINCFDFKTNCLHIYNYLVPFVNKDSTTLNLRDVYLSKNTTPFDVSDDQDVCGLCMSLVKYCVAVSIDVEEGGTLLKKMIEQCLPELDLSIIKKPVICLDCHSSLENCFRFVTNCMAAEEKIKTYCERLDVSSRGQLELSDLLHTAMGTVEASDVNGDSVDVKAGIEFFVKIENPEERGIGGVGDIIKLEQISCYDNEYVNKEQEIAPNSILACVDEDNVLGTIKIENAFFEEIQTEPEDGNFAEMDDQKFTLNKEIEMKTDEHDFNRMVENITQTRVNAGVNGGRKCLKINLEEGHLKPHINQTLMRKDITKISYQCEDGLFNMKDRQGPIHFHRTTPEVTIFNCYYCIFQTRRKYELEHHLLKHRKSLEETTLNCKFCSYQAKNKSNLKQHLIAHKESPEVYTCDYCLFHTKRKSNLKMHIMRHIDPAEVTMLTCNLCSYQSKYKSKLEQHSIIHKACSEVTMYKCNICIFQTRWKQSLKSHMLQHMTPSQVTVFKCEFCLYQTKYKHKLKRHTCFFRTRRKNFLENSVLKPMDPPEVTTFNCDHCSFNTKYEICLKQHLATHKASLEITTFKCDSCPFQTEQNDILQSHMLKHQ